MLALSGNTNAMAFVMIKIAKAMAFGVGMMTMMIFQGNGICGGDDDDDDFPRRWHLRWG